MELVVLSTVPLALYKMLVFVPVVVHSMLYPKTGRFVIPIGGCIQVTVNSVSEANTETFFGGPVVSDTNCIITIYSNYYYLLSS